MKKSRGSKVRVLVFPVDLETGYQQPLYREVAAQGIDVGYLEIGTPSQTLNLLLIPLSLVWHRLQGYNVWHIHWAYPFSTFWSHRIPYGRRVMQRWFGLCLTTAHIFGFKVVWTAHNVLPHDRIFEDDVAARLRLTRAADAVIAHQEVAVPKLEALGAHNIHVIPPGSYTREYKDGISRDEARQLLGLGSNDRVVVFVGRVVPYKQVDWLLEAAARLPEDDTRLRVVVAGACRDRDLLVHLRRLAAEAGPRVIVRFGFVPDDELQVYFACADVAALPFSRVTSSGSAILAMSFGVPLLLPDLPELAYFPDSVAIRYAPNFEALVDALARVAMMEPEILLELSEGSRKHAASLSWELSGQTTATLYRELLNSNWSSPPARGDETANYRG